MRRSGFSVPDPQPLTHRQQRARKRELAKTTTCDTCGGELVVFEINDNEPTRWTHATGGFHTPLPANMNGD